MHFICTEANTILVLHDEVTSALTDARLNVLHSWMIQPTSMLLGSRLVDSFTCPGELTCMEPLVCRMLFHF